MPKRGSESLTGGTGDVNPQWFNMTSAANITASFATTTVPTPINKFPEGSGRVVIMEVLKAYLYINAGTLVAFVTGNDYNLEAWITTKNFATTAPTNAADGTILAKFQREWLATAADAGRITNDYPFVIDLTDGAGHGMLVATDNLYLGIRGGSATVPYTSTTVSCKILYRFKKVSLQEYIGIVQSQQNS